MNGMEATVPKSKPCFRCGNEVAEFAVRNDRLCRTCFPLNISHKVIRALTRWRHKPRYQSKVPKCLLALSLGLSSTSMLHVIDEYLSKSKGRKAFSLTVVNVGEANQDSSFEALQRRYPSHEYVQLAKQALPVQSFEEATDGNLQAFQAPSEQPGLLETLIHKALELDCDAILLGHTSTRIASAIFTETANGRASKIPSLFGEDASQGGIDIVYPMREIFPTELAEYSQIVQPPLTVRPQRVPQKQAATIDGLMQNYFSSLETNFPNIVSSVVKSTGRLQDPDANLR